MAHQTITKSANIKLITTNLSKNYKTRNNNKN
jgi:hypothetical protein